MEREHWLDCWYLSILGHVVVCAFTDIYCGLFVNDSLNTKPNLSTQHRSYFVQPAGHIHKAVPHTCWINASTIKSSFFFLINYSLTCLPFSTLCLPSQKCSKLQWLPLYLETLYLIISMSWWWSLLLKSSSWDCSSNSQASLIPCLHRLSTKWLHRSSDSTASCTWSIRHTDYNVDFF